MGLKFGTLWFGNEPTLLQQISWNSYLYHGHELYIYLYDMSIKVPNGAIKKDANEIMLEKDIFLTKFDDPLCGGGHQQFADLFRLHMLKKTDLIWTDSDMVCLTDTWPDPEPYLFGFFVDTPHPAKGPIRINNDILYINNDEILDDLINNFVCMPTATKGDQIKYGPVLLTDIISKNNLMHFVKEERIFHPIRYSHTRDFLNPFIFEYTKGLMANSIAISLFNSSWLMHSLEIPKMDSTPQENTLIGHLTKKYIPVELY
jgi:hypothetical protein